MALFGVKKKEWKQLSQGMMAGAVLAIGAAAWGFLVSDIFLASTQWLLVAAVLALFGIWSKSES